MTERASRIAITGVGIVSALGADSGTTFARLVKGDVGIRPVELFDVAGQRCRLAAEVSGLEVRDVAPSSAADSWSRSDAMAVVAAGEALTRAGLGSSPTGIGLAVGGTTGGMREAEEVLTKYTDVLPAECARRLLGYPLSTPAERVAQQIGGVERIATLCSACSSSANAIALGGAWISQGKSRVVLAGGSDGLCRLTFAGFNALGVMSSEPCRPFDVHRSGMSLGEGAAFLVLEAEADAIRRGAEVLGFLSGFSVAAEAYHITHPEPQADTATWLIESALCRAGLTPSDVDYVNAHGTATPQNDAAEARALVRAFGSELQRVCVSSSKGQVGHTLGAAGAIEAALTVLALGAGIVPPTAGLETPDPEIPLHHVLGRGQPQKIRAALSSSFGFGGTGVVLAFESSASEPRSVRAHAHSICVSSVRVAGPAGDSALSYFGAGESEGSPELAPEKSLDPARSRRFDRVSLLITEGCKEALSSADVGPERVGLAAGTAYGNVQRSVEFLRRLFERGPRFASPAEFPHLVPSAAAGNASIYLGLSGPVFAVSELGACAEAALGVALSFLEAGVANRMIAGGAESRDAIVTSVLGPLHSGIRADRRGEGAAWIVVETEEAIRARGGKPIARLSFWDEGKERVVLPTPSSPEACVVAAPGLEHLLEGSEWGALPRHCLGGWSLPEEVRGAFFLAAGVALIESGRAREVLVMSEGNQTVRAFCFVRP